MRTQEMKSTLLINIIATLVHYIDTDGTDSQVLFETMHVPAFGWHAPVS